ncbi:MAG: 3-oxoacyl-ACP reductase FabG [Chloroflexi bacterium]|nr:3-oxoacyl-ACP reductase FabG [Chloroflexota bacterium]
MGKLDGKVAIVTGSGRGLGRAFAIALANEGCSVVTNSVDPEKKSANQTAEEIKKAGGKAVPVIASIALKASAELLVDTAVKEFGRLDIIVNNAGITKDALLHKMTEEQWDDCLNVHLKGSFLLSQAAVKNWIENRIKGKIINITSGVGIHGNLGQTNYAAAKGGLIAMTKTHSKELVKYGICVNAVAPLARTEMFNNMRDELKNWMFDVMGKKNVLQKIGEPEDVAPVIVFLASDDSHFVSGQIICATGDVGELPWD